MYFSGKSGGAEIEEFRQTGEDRLRAEEPLAGEERDREDVSHQEDGQGGREMGKILFEGSLIIILKSGIFFLTKNTII